MKANITLQLQKIKLQRQRITLWSSNTPSLFLAEHVIFCVWQNTPSSFWDTFIDVFSGPLFDYGMATLVKPVKR